MVAQETKGWSRDYGRIEKAIHFIEDNMDDSPGLADLAKAAGLSEFHFQRLFSRMVGLSPKRYEQFLRKENAKELLGSAGNLLDASWDAGLSGPGRLHDLFVTCEAMTPGEYRAQGSGITIRYGFHPTPFGEAFIAMTDRGICSLSFAAPGERPAALDGLKKEWNRAEIREDARGTAPVVAAIFADEARARAPLTLYLRGTNFQVKVWEALIRIPQGKVATYEQVARRVGNARATRAVGAAVGRNPVAFLIPCHRVIRKSGEIGDYHWGAPRKRMILAWEAERAEQRAG
jgi:AraC family transcriptional regulator, regulatory protein of adaptative response / methylated-DNA-[protein]-cysteine methyltransferase